MILEVAARVQKNALQKSALFKEKI